jgi:hypothetical protein
MSGFVATVGKVKIPSRPDFMAGLYVDEMRKRERFMNEDTSKAALAHVRERPREHGRPDKAHREEPPKAFSSETGISRAYQKVCVRGQSQAQSNDEKEPR